MMAVDFCDYFWGEKHDGFNVIYQVMHLGQKFASGMEHSPIGEPLSLALENVAILWWATPPEN